MKIAQNEIKHERIDGIIRERWKAIRCLAKDIPIPGKSWSGSGMFKEEVAGLLYRIFFDPASCILIDEPIVTSESPIHVEELPVPDMIPVLIKHRDEIEEIYDEEDDDLDTSKTIFITSRRILGSYSAMHSTGCIRIYISTCMDLAMRLLCQWIKRAKYKADYWSYEVFKWISYATMIATYSHELFHHACDVLQQMVPYVRSPDPEEPLAVAFAMENTDLVNSTEILSKDEYKTLKNYYLRERFSVDAYPSPYNKFENYYDKGRKQVDYSKLRKYILNFSMHPIQDLLISKLVNRIHDLHVDVIYGVNRYERIFKQNPCQKIL